MKMLQECRQKKAVLLAALVTLLSDCTTCRYADLLVDLSGCVHQIKVVNDQILSHRLQIELVSIREIDLTFM